MLVPFDPLGDLRVQVKEAEKRRNRRRIRITAAVIVVGVLGGVVEVVSRHERQAIEPDPAATAVCRDGSYSFSSHRQGTCAQHGGVRTWLKQPEPDTPSTEIENTVNARDPGGVSNPPGTWNGDAASQRDSLAKQVSDVLHDGDAPGACARYREWQRLRGHSTADTLAIGEDACGRADAPFHTQRRIPP